MVYLFYFNLLLSVHYSPFKNLYFGTDIQYSVLTNDVALFENSKGYTLRPAALPPNDTLLISSKIGNLKRTPAYRELRTNEFRFLFDVKSKEEKKPFKKTVVFVKTKAYSQPLILTPYINHINRLNFYDLSKKDIYKFLPISNKIINKI